MKPEYERYQQIDNYLNDKLSEAERENFSQLLKEDATLADQVKLQALTNDLIIENRFNAIFAAAATTYEREQSNLKNKLWGFGATLLIASTALFYFYNTSKTPTTSLTSLKPKEVLESTLVKNDPSAIKPVEAKTKQSASPLKEELVTITLPTNTTVLPQVDIQKEVTALQKEDKIFAHAAPILPAIVANLCDHVNIDAQLYQTPSCENDNNGLINIASTTIKGGIAPYVYSINGGQHYQKSATFEHLSAGNYQVFIKDVNGCFTLIDKSYQLEAKKCYKTLNFSFNPQMGEAWTHTLDTPTSFHVKVLNKQGQTVWKSSQTDSQTIHWEGNTFNGEPLETGIYLYEINFSNGTAEHGTITVLK